MGMQGLADGQHEVYDNLCWRFQQGTLHQWHLLHSQHQLEESHAASLARRKLGWSRCLLTRKQKQAEGGTENRGDQCGSSVLRHRTASVTKRSNACSAAAAIWGVSGWNLQRRQHKLLLHPGCTDVQLYKRHWFTASLPV